MGLAALPVGGYNDTKLGQSFWIGRFNVLDFLRKPFLVIDVVDGDLLGEIVGSLQSSVVLLLEAVVVIRRVQSTANGNQHPLFPSGNPCKARLSSSSDVGGQRSRSPLRKAWGRKVHNDQVSRRQGHGVVIILTQVLDDGVVYLFQATKVESQVLTWRIRPSAVADHVLIKIKGGGKRPVFVIELSIAKVGLTEG